MNQFLGIIPARYASTRFPGKPLARLGNKPMIQWVYERASAVLPLLVVATDDHRIKNAVEDFGGKAVITSGAHQTGTERCAEALELFNQSASEKITHVINIQGDEPLLKKEHLGVLINCFKDPQTRISTLIQPLQRKEGLADQNLVKVVVNKKFHALYFSRSPIPFVRENPAGQVTHPFYSHIGLYAFQAETLTELVQLPASKLELAESLEQLRWLENGYSIQCALTDQPAMGVDTPEDLEAISKLI